MNENEWTKEISLKLNKEFCKGNIHAKILQKIPYSRGMGAGTHGADQI